MSSPLSRHWSLAELSRYEGRMDGTILVGQCERLSELHQGPADTVIRVSAVLSPHGVAAMRGKPALVGRADAGLQLVCQRCLEPVEYAAAAEFAVVFVATLGDLSDGPGYDLWETGSATLRLADVVEESLLLALPMSVMHAEQECRIRGVGGASDPEPGGITQTPFAGLSEALKKQRGDRGTKQ